MLLCANAALEENKQKINELNVFPVPDGDTGTNMSLTMNSAAIELGRKQTDTVGAVADCAASALRCLSRATRLSFNLDKRPPKSGSMIIDGIPLLCNSPYRYSASVFRAFVSFACFQST